MMSQNRTPLAPGHCPNDATLAALALGKLTVSEQDAIYSHIQDCPDCASHLDDFDQLGDPILSAIGFSDSDCAILVEPECQGMAGRLERLLAHQPGGKIERTQSLASDSGTVGWLPESGTIREYQLLELLGRGGMGVVYKAMHTRLNKIVALKVLDPRLNPGEATVLRFEREMKAVGKLNHPNIVAATDAGVAEGRHYLAMELVEGIDCARLLRSSGPLPIPSACELARQVAVGLQHAHECGLIHRDIKPHNVMVTSAGHVKVLDFGLARFLPDELAGPTLTNPDQLMGTLNYIAPEQLMNATAVDIRADIYSLGCSLYHLLAGAPPFSGPEFENSAQKIYAHCHRIPRPIRDLRPDVPEALADTLGRMLAKRPTDRFPEPRAVAEALAGFASRADLTRLVTPIGDRPRGPIGDESNASCRTGSTVTSGGLRRSKRLVYLASAVLLAGLAFLGVHWSGSHPDASKQHEPDVRPGTGAVTASPAEPSGSAPAEDLAGAAVALLKTYCYRCHGIDFKAPDLNVLDRDVLTAARDDSDAYVTPGDPEKSLLWLRLGVEGDMPPGKAPRPSDGEKNVLKRWVEAGAPFPVGKARGFRGPRSTLLAIRDHLKKTDPPSRRYQRYFTFANLFSNRSVDESELRLARAALAKLVNSLSWQPTIVVPTPIDADETVLRVDLRDLGWDSEDDVLWSELLRAHPYGLKYDRLSDSDSDSDGAELATEVEALSESELPYLRADWFIATASRPPLYHTLLRLPHRDRGLEEMLKVDVIQDFLRDRLVRAGFGTSGVSEQNRLVDRHESPYGAYWKSYDFKTNQGTGDLLRFPLGPVFEENPFDRHSFEHAGGEILFNLPCGLLGYFLIDGEGRRIDVGPIDVVNDPLKNAGTPSIVTGISCMGCHKHGVIRFKDAIRRGTPLLGEARRKVERLFPTTEVMDQRLSQDEDRFLKALRTATGPFLLVGNDRGKDIREFPEPIGAVARLYQKDLGLAEVAMELGMDDPRTLDRLIRDKGRLREIGLGPLRDGHRIKRALWEALDPPIYSRFQDAAQELNLGHPRRKRGQ